MTTIEGIPDSSEVKEGMAFFANTGPLATTCGECVHRGYYRPLPDKYDPTTGQTVTRQRKTQGCAMFKKLSGRHGPVVEAEWPSCKYFERKPA